MGDKNRLARYVEGLVPREFRTRGAIAKAIGMTDSGFSRAVQDDGTLTVEQCLRLAIVLKEDLSSILRMAGREALAGMAERSFRRSEEQLSKREMELLRLWREASLMEQQAVFSVLDVVVSRARTAPSGSRPRADKLERRILADERAVSVAAARVAKTTTQERRKTT